MLAVSNVLQKTLVNSLISVGGWLIMKTIHYPELIRWAILTYQARKKQAAIQMGRFRRFQQPSPKVPNLQTINSRSLFIWLPLRLSRLLQTLERNFLEQCFHVRRCLSLRLCLIFPFLFLAELENQGRKFMAWQRWARHFHLGCQIKGSQCYWKHRINKQNQT